jgi:hypothetical protein
VTKELRAHFARAVEEGWLPHFRAAATRYAERVEVLMGIASRETEMGGDLLPDGSFEWLVKPGDGGHGFGLMQVDRKSYPEWVATGAWQHAHAGIHQGAAVLAAKRDGLMRRAGQIVSVTDRKTRAVYRFTMPHWTDPGLLEKVAIAAFNSGDWAPYHVTKGRDCDFGTTGKNYSDDVLKRADLFRRWLSEMQEPQHETL